MEIVPKKFAGPTAHRRVRTPVTPSAVLLFPDRAKWGAPGLSAGKVRGKLTGWIPLNLPRGHGDLVFAMDPVDAFRTHP